MVRERLDGELLASPFLWASDLFTGNGVRGRLVARFMMGGTPGAGSLTIPVNPWENLVRNACNVRTTDGCARTPPACAIADEGEDSACWMSAAVGGGGMGSCLKNCVGIVNSLVPLCTHTPLTSETSEPTGKLHNFPCGARWVRWTTSLIILSRSVNGAKEVSGGRKIERLE